MSAITKPMLAGKMTEADIANLHFPLLATPKLDGIRCLILNGKAVTRKLKAYPNFHIQATLEGSLPDGLDGEIMLPGCASPFDVEHSGGITKRTGQPAFAFCVFDYVPGALDQAYAARMAALAALPLPSFVEKILPTVVRNAAELLQYESEIVAQGFEGIMLRDPMGRYKDGGRSTLREELLLKWKRFEDAEAEILDVIEGLSNQNAAEKDALGHTKRSTKQEGMVGRGTAGSLLVRDIKTGVEFNVGTKDTKSAAEIWARRDTIKGEIIVYRYQPTGVKDLPRFPTFRCFRAEADMPELQEA